MKIGQISGGWSRAGSTEHSSNLHVGYYACADEKFVGIRKKCVSYTEKITKEPAD